MEAIFGARMARRQEQVRATIGASDLDHLLRESGLLARAQVSLADVPTVELLAELAPPAPTGRYALGTDMRPKPLSRSKAATLWIAGGVAAGIAIGAIVTLTVVARRSSPAPIVVPAQTATAPSAIANVRKIVLSLPFPATQVTFDEITREFDPATNVAAFDVAMASGPRHRVSAVGADGTRADGYVREEEGVARVDPLGFTVVAPEAVPVDPKREAPSSQVRPPKPLGKVRNGFTRLQ